MGIRINNNIVNQKGNPAWYEDTLAARPTANLQGRMFVDTNTPSTGIYRDTGSTWIQVADPGAGTTGTLQQVTTNGSTTNVGISITTLTPGSVLFSGTGGLISQDNTNLFWDDANNFFGIGPTGGPTALLDIHSATQNVFVQVNATSTNNSTIAFLNGGVGKWRVGNLYNAGSNDFTIYDTTNATSRLTIANTGTATYNGFLVVNNISSTQNVQILGTAPAYTMGITSGGNYGASIGMASVANNFINGSALGDMCIVNQTVGGANLKLGVLSANAAAINISPANRVQIATSTDAGYAFDVNGTARISGATTIGGKITSTLGNNLLIFSSDSATTGFQFMRISNTGGNFAFGIEQSSGTALFGNSLGYATVIGTSNSTVLQFGTNATIRMSIFTNGNTLISTGTQTDAGYKLDVNGTTRLQGALTATSAILSGNFQAGTTGGGVTAGDLQVDSTSLSSKVIIGRLSSTTNDTTTLIGQNRIGVQGWSITAFGVATFNGAIAIGNTLTAAVAAPSTHKVSIMIGGVQYYLLASNV